MAEFDSRSESDDVEDCVAECLDLWPSMGEAAIDRVCGDRPELLDAVRSAIDRLGAIGLLPEPTIAGGRIPKSIAHYDLIESIGMGGMGQVYRARCQKTDRLVALKVIRPDHVRVPAARERFEREIESLSRLEHPNVVTVYDHGEAGGIPYYAMEWIDGVGLDRVIARFHALGAVPTEGRAILRDLDASGEIPDGFRGSWWEAWTHIGRQVADALVHCHARGVVHRDLKPSNLILTADGVVRLVDFGLAQPEGVDRMTRTGTHIGSLPYMSPEQVRGDKHALGPACDIYSLGVLLYEGLTLQLPFLDETSEGLRSKILEGRCEPIERINPAVPRRLGTVARKAMEIEAGRRYSSAAEFVADLESILQGARVSARESSLVLRARRWVARHPVRTVAALLSLVLIAVLASWLHQADRVLEEREDRDRLSRLLARAPQIRSLDDGRLPELATWLDETDALLAKEERYQALLDEVPDDSPRAHEIREIVASLSRLASHRETIAEHSSIALRSYHDARRDATWPAAIRAIASSERYGGLALEPQGGLLPLRADPVSGLWEFLYLPTHDGPPTVEIDERGRYRIEARTGVVLVLVPGGSHWVGAKQTDSDEPRGAPVDPHPREGPERVDLEPFFISKYELTRAQWFRMMSFFGSNWRREWKGDQAIEPQFGKTWDRARRYLEWVGLELPSFQQWEVACRAGEVHEIAYDLDRLLRVANVRESAHGRVLPVGSFESNAFGLHDVRGNLLEWCFEHAQRRGAQGGHRIVRGGAYDLDASCARASWWDHAPYDLGAQNIGVRPVRALSR